ncbi:hypothetical protein FALBO_9550 [Fusarium albosuccineum]|uniref:Uncharacterized protein n=1 Tax=Fusarium albosuccineum TaxID=1237068 RepID=A0A8H4L7L1_9HYPO|nr:hypothetical protein FALBO_9550 [Fusarium albosuccineum]
MRFDFTALLATLATTCAADRMVVYTKCGLTSCNSRQAVFYTDWGTYDVNADEGCRGTSVPGMIAFCVDWGRKRGHFQYSGQNKRCMLMRAMDPYGCDWDHCHKSTWEETTCNWKRDDEAEVDDAIEV